MSVSPSHKNSSRWHRRLVAALLTSSLVNQLIWVKSAAAQSQTNASPFGAYCQLSTDAIAQKDTLRQAAQGGDRDAQSRYQSLLTQQAEQLRRCRNQTWPQTQAIWLRLYPCDARPGAIDELLDRIVSKGYNEVYLEAFYNGQVLLPAAQNNTSWPSVIRNAGYENRDLLAEVIAKGRERGLKVYAWMFTMNFGYTYAQRPNTQGALAFNGFGQTSLTSNTATAGPNGESTGPGSEETFADPYSLQAKRDYYVMAQAIAQRRPDGMLFDYIRYPKGSGTASVASRVQDLWIYGPASQQALFDRALNQKGRELIRRFLSRGYITATDLTTVDSLYPSEGVPMWQGRTPPNFPSGTTAAQRQPYLQTELWQLGVAHAVQGILDFLAMALLPAQRQGIPGGAVFFPEGNQPIGRGYDSRLQPWDRFPSSIEWHPMSYAICGPSNTGCITAQVQRVLSLAQPGTQVKPVIAGVWGRSISNRPSLEAQMQAIRQATPQINSVSHFAYSWQEPQSDNQRKFCQLR
ncbi:MAG: hypothetical protein F6K28_42290 [Microcoleus sp. SIO2G3]|nr:hypothetical protein [Microcoleus sp. SIO2G3]